MNKDVSVVIVNWNTREMLRDCLTSVFRETKRAAFEVIVVDNASSDGSGAMVEEAFPDVRLIRNGENAGFARGCNQGMQTASGRYFLLLNSDTEVLDDALSTLVEFMDQNRDVGVSGCTLLYPDGALQPSCGWFPTLPGTLFHGLGPRALLRKMQGDAKHFPSPFLSYGQHAHQWDVDWIVGACLLVRREVAERVGMMDEAIFMFSEEWEWCFRIKSAGWRIAYTPEARVMHVGSASWTMSDGKRVWAILSSQQYFYRKHYGRLRAALLKLFIFLNASAKTVLWSGVSLVRSVSRRAQSQDVYWHLYSLQWCLRMVDQAMLTSEDVEPPSENIRGADRNNKGTDR